MGNVFTKEGRKIKVEIIRKMRKESLIKWRNKRGFRTSNKTYTYIPPCLELPYSEFSEKGVAYFLYDHFGLENGRAVYRVQSWKYDKKTKRVKFITLCVIKIIGKEEGRIVWFFINKKNISRSKAWRHKDTIPHVSY